MARLVELAEGGQVHRITGLSLEEGLLRKGIPEPAGKPGAEVEIIGVGAADTGGAGHWTEAAVVLAAQVRHGAVVPSGQGVVEVVPLQEAAYPQIPQATLLRPCRLRFDAHLQVVQGGGKTRLGPVLKGHQVPVGIDRIGAGFPQKAREPCVQGAFLIPLAGIGREVVERAGGAEFGKIIPAVHLVPGPVLLLPVPVGAEAPVVLVAVVALSVPVRSGPGEQHVAACQGHDPARTGLGQAVRTATRHDGGRSALFSRLAARKVAGDDIDRPVRCAGTQPDGDRRLEHGDRLDHLHRDGAQVDATVLVRVEGPAVEKDKNAARFPRTPYGYPRSDPGRLMDLHAGHGLQHLFHAEKASFDDLFPSDHLHVLGMVPDVLGEPLCSDHHGIHDEGPVVSLFPEGHGNVGKKGRNQHKCQGYPVCHVTSPSCTKKIPGPDFQVRGCRFPSSEIKKRPSLYHGEQVYEIRLRRSSGFRIILLAASSHPALSGNSDMAAAFIPGYGGGSATDSHRLPCYGLMRPLE
ncbi:MAG: hypothetical protein A4E57_03979 [Syntrophorhabdaceae bacterium PtaU1.Bin034]|nr:MAG: hypothetical protein A4E57_03979 [Syntrophorhabdaceae bacterium PtaU1.Bin034]